MIDPSRIRNLGIMIAAAVTCAISTFANSAEPKINAVEGAPIDGNTVIISGSNFTPKKSAKPLLFWFADSGIEPSTLGRKIKWDGAFSGELVDKSTPGALVAAGSDKAVRLDHGKSSDAILGKVSFNSDQLYVWRKRLDDFDRLKDGAIRTRYKNMTPLKTGAKLMPGMLMSTRSGAVWGKVADINTSGSTAGSIYYSNKVGTVLDKQLARMVPTGEKLYFYEPGDINRTTPVIMAELDEGKGIFHTFNHKIIRFWGKYGVHNNNTYISLDSDGMAYNEYTSTGTHWMKDWNNPIQSAVRRWVVEEFQYQAGTTNQEDGILLFWQDGVKAWDRKRFRFTTDEHPNKYSDLFQSQVSNGAQENSYGYYDSLYVDDSWHRVMICTEATWAKCRHPEIVIPTEWSDTRISVVLRHGSLKGKGRFYFYVVNGQGEVNSKGFGSCPECPQPPFVQ
jgi:hypothetical protein